MTAMSEPNRMTEGAVQELEGMLSPRVQTSGLPDETNIEAINEMAFELYKEAWSMVNLAAHLLDESAMEKGGWARNQAICAGLLIRLTKFMLVVVQLSAKEDRAEVVSALNRSICESAINLEFLVRTNDDKYFDQFVQFSLGPERDLYDSIQANIAARGGDVWPIEQRMLNSIRNLCEASGMRIEEIDRKQRDWGGKLRDRLGVLHKEMQYVGIQRLPSHAVHGTWVDLYLNHLEHDKISNVFSPHPSFSRVDERLLGPIAIFVLEATEPYLIRFFHKIPVTKVLLRRIQDLRNRIYEAGTAHERLLTKGE